MKIIISFFIFCLVLFIYLHIQFHLKTSNDLEIYEIDDVSKDKLEEICDLRQPVLFDFNNEKIIQTTNSRFILENYPAFEMKIRNINENDSNSELYVNLPLHASDKLFREDKNSAYFSENNSDFLNETGVIKNFKYNDEYLRPYMVSNLNYDIMLGSNGTYTPFRYEINYRNYFLSTEGSIQIKMAPPQSTKYLYPEYDYENFEFRSPVNPWKVQTKYAADFEKMKCLEVELSKGKMIYVPAYWWYSIRFIGNNSSISCFRYRTYVNNLAISPYISMHMLQLQNIKRDVTKKISADVLKNKVNDNLSEPHSSVNNSNNESINEISIQTTTSINDLENDNNNNNNNNNKSETKEDPKPIMEYENFGAEIK
jgi:hypothetical protein